MTILNKERKGWGDRVLKFYIFMAFVFLFLPIAIIIVFSLNSGRYPSFPLQDFTVKWYKELMLDSRLLGSVKNSLIVAATVSFISTVLGFMGAYALRSYKLKAENFFLGFMAAPLTVPTLLLGLALLIFLNSFLSLQNSLLSVIISHTVFCAPFALFIIRARLRNVRISMEEAAWDLGAGRWQTVKELILPLCAPGLIAAALLTFTLSFDEFIIAWFVSGFQPTLPVKIWTMMRGGIKPTINAIGAIVFIFSMSILLIGEYFLGKKTNG
ncbi:MAG: ABC transporter permease [Desulfobacterales bacterium]|jgi:spermidine/putrescine transport system permease protein|nr:MAG: ABC transporter permease [Desulfobacterales bacterium]